MSEQEPPGPNPSATDSYNDDSPAATAQMWITEITLAEKEFETWTDECKNILKRYRDESDEIHGNRGDSTSSRYNILWSNIQTLQPALYARTPKPEIERRFKDQDPDGRLAAQVLERSVTESIKAYDFDSVIRDCRDDYLLCGRGTAWVRYVPHYKTKTPRTALEKRSGPQRDQTDRSVPSQDTMISTTPDSIGEGMGAENEELSEKYYGDDGSEVDTSDKEVLYDDNGYYYNGEPYEEVDHEEVIADYVHWSDFIHNPARRWLEVRWVGRKVYMTRDELIKRFGKEIGNDLNLDFLPRNIKEQLSKLPSEQAKFKKAIVYEIWDKVTRKVYWINKGYPVKPLDEKEDPLGLYNFFPCPRPLYATTTTDSLIPVPDYVEYRHLAEELDEVTSRISKLTMQVRIAAVHDASFDEIKRIFQEDIQNNSIPVKDWPRFIAQGAFDGVIQFLPLDMVLKALESCYEMREQLINTIYETTGMSDIIRGAATNPQETATAQQIKGQFAVLRLSDRQAEIQRFAKDIIAIKAEIIAGHFSPNTIALMSGVQLLDPPAMQGFERALKILEDDEIRTFRIGIETDSTIATDDDMEKRNVTEFLTSVGQFMQQSIVITTQMPPMVPVFMEMLLFAVRRFRVGRNLETAIEQGVEGVIQQAQQNQQMQMAQQQAQIQQMQQAGQAQNQAVQGKLQIEQQKAQGQQQLTQAKVDSIQLGTQAKSQEKAIDAAIESQKFEHKAQLETASVVNDARLKEKELQSTLVLKAEEIRGNMALASMDLAGKHAIAKEAARSKPQTQPRK